MLLGAGSGKTAVLVERIINKVVNEGVAIDRLLVVTFTRAAAQEMKERLADRLYIEAQNNPILNEQINNLSKASITTIDGFCNRVVQDNFFKLGIDPNYRIGDNSELEWKEIHISGETSSNAEALKDATFWIVTDNLKLKRI